MRVRSESYSLDYFYLLTEPSVQRDQDTVTLFEDDIQTAYVKGSFWVWTSDYDAFNV